MLKRMEFKVAELWGKLISGHWISERSVIPPKSVHP